MKARFRGDVNIQSRSLHRVTRVLRAQHLPPYMLVTRMVTLPLEESSDDYSSLGREHRAEGTIHY